MSRRLSLNKILAASVVSVAVFAAVQSGWLSIDVEFGGTRTGTLSNPTVLPNEQLDNALDKTGVAPELEANIDPFDDGQRQHGTGVTTNRDSGLGEDSPRIYVSGIIQVSEEQAADGAKTKPSDTAGTSAAPFTELNEPPVRVAARPNGADAKLDLTSIDAQIKAGQLLEAHKALSKIFWQQPELRTRIQERIDATAKAIYFSPQPHVQEPHVIQAGDQLRKIAGEHHVPWQYLAKLNRIDPRRIREGQKLKVIDGPFGAVVTLADFEFVLHHNGRYVRSYRVCIGKDDSTPVGKFQVLNKVTSPQYTDPDGKVFAGTDPKNPLGSHWIDLGESYGIHGTIEPDSIGKAESRGCIRLLNADVAEVFDMLDLGSEVIIRR